MRFLKNHKKIMLIITENCNLACRYCYEQNKHKKAMTFETAKEIIDRAYSKMDGYDSMVIELHGGEPFLNFPLMCQIDEYVMSNYSSTDVLFRAITNGTLVHGEIQEWLYERRDRYEIMLSLDGVREQHDLNRCFPSGKGSYEMIDLNFFQKTWDKCPVSMTINEDTLEELANNTIAISEMGFDCLNAFEWAYDWDLEKNIPILKNELKKLVEYYSKNTDMQICLLMRNNFTAFFLPVDENYRYCVDIDDPLECYDAAGKYAPCHGFTDFTVGNPKKAAEFADMSISDFTFEDKNICKGCKLVRLCRICFAANYMLSGDMQIQNEAICVFNRICLEAAIEVQKKRISLKEAMSDYDREVIRAADAIAEYIMDKRFSTTI